MQPFCFWSRKRPLELLEGQGFFYASPRPIRLAEHEPIPHAQLGATTCASTCTCMHTLPLPLPSLLEFYFPSKFSLPARRASERARRRQWHEQTRPSSPPSRRLDERKSKSSTCPLAARSNTAKACEKDDQVSDRPIRALKEMHLANSSRPPSLAPWHQLATGQFFTLSIAPRGRLRSST